jgi:hypothetical protein
MHRPAAAPRSALILTLALGACAGPSAINGEAEPEDSLIGGEISSRPSDAEAPAPGDLAATAARLDLDLRLVSDSTGELAAPQPAGAPCAADAQGGHVEPDLAILELAALHLIGEEGTPDVNLLQLAEGATTPGYAWWVTSPVAPDRRVPFGRYRAARLALRSVEARGWLGTPTLEAAPRGLRLWAAAEGGVQAGDLTVSVATTELDPSAAWATVEAWLRPDGSLVPVEGNAPPADRLRIEAEALGNSALPLDLPLGPDGAGLEIGPETEGRLVIDLDLRGLLRFWDASTAEDPTGDGLLIAGEDCGIEVHAPTAALDLD